MHRGRLLSLSLIVLGLWIVAWASGVTGRFTSDSIRSVVAGKGLGGIVIFTLIFATGQLLRLPSTVFVAAAIAAYGRDSGFLVALLGGLVSATVSFTVVPLIPRIQFTACVTATFFTGRWSTCVM